MICLDLSEKTLTGRVNSTDLQNLFGSFSVEMPEDQLDLSFAIDVLKALKFSNFINEIKTLSSEIVLHRDLRDDDKRPETVYAYVVDIKCKRKQVIICEKVICFFLFI